MTIARRPGEPPLGNPASSGLVLASTTAGVRSWAAPVDQAHRSAAAGAHTMSAITGLVPSLESAMPDFVTRSSNLANYNGVTDQTSISGTTGELVYNATNATSVFIRVQPSTQYTVDRIGRKAFYDQNKTFISSDTTKGTHHPRKRLLRQACSGVSLLDNLIRYSGLPRRTACAWSDHSSDT